MPARKKPACPVLTPLAVRDLYAGWVDGVCDELARVKVELHNPASPLRAGLSDDQAERCVAQIGHACDCLEDARPDVDELVSTEELFAAIGGTGVSADRGAPTPAVPWAAAPRVKPKGAGARTLAEHDARFPATSKHVRELRALLRQAESLRARLASYRRRHDVGRGGCCVCDLCTWAGGAFDDRLAALAVGLETFGSVGQELPGRG